MDSKAEADGLMVIIVVHFFTRDVIIEGLFRFKLFQNEPSNTLFNTLLKILVSAEIFYVLVGKILTIYLTI